MKSAALLTVHNLLMREPLTRSGYNLAEYQIPVSPEDLKEIIGGSYRHVLIELDESHLENIRPVIEEAGEGQSLLCLGDPSSASAREFLLAYGVSDCLPKENPERVLAYLNSLQKAPRHGSERIMVLDQAGPSRRIISNIIARFGYKAVFSESTEKAFDSLPGALQMVIVNLGMERLDVNQLIRRAYGMQELKGVPFLVFKDMGKGLFVHELISGLNRITRFVLSDAELYSLLVDLFFHREIMPLVTGLRESLRHEDGPSPWRGALGQVFHRSADGLLAAGNILAEDPYRAMIERADAVKKSLLRIDGLRWLRMDYSPSTPIYGAGGAE